MEWLGGTSPEVLHGQGVHTKVTKAKAKTYIVNVLELEKSRVDHLGRQSRIHCRRDSRGDLQTERWTDRPTLDFIGHHVRPTSGLV